MTINKLLTGAVLVGMIACYGCEPEEPITIERDPVEVAVEVEGKTEVNTNRNEEIIQTHNSTLNAFRAYMAEGLFDGDFFNPGNNQFHFLFYNPAPGYWYHVYWGDGDITVYGGTGATDTVAFVSNPFTSPWTISTQQVGYFNKDTAGGVGQGFCTIAYNSFTETVYQNDNCVVAWTYSFNLTGSGTMTPTDTLAYILAEGIGQDMGVPYPHTARFIYKKGATIDTSEVTMTQDSIQYASDTSWTKNYWHATGGSRAVSDTLDKVEFLDTEDRIITTEPADYPFASPGAIRQPYVITLNYTPAGGP